MSNPNAMVDKALFYIADSAGLRKLRQVKGNNNQDGGSGQVIKGPSGPLGTAGSEGGHTISLTVVRNKGVEDEVDWDGLKRSKELFRFEIQYEGSDRHQYLMCRVFSINDDPGSGDGNVSREITIMTHLESNIIKA